MRRELNPVARIQNTLISIHLEASQRSSHVLKKSIEAQELPADDAKRLLPNHLVDDDSEVSDGTGMKDTVVRVPLSPEVLSTTGK